jgi:hypothetical protein
MNLIPLMYFYSEIYTYIFRVTYLLQEYSLVECVKLFQNIEIPMVRFGGGEICVQCFGGET